MADQTGDRQCPLLIADLECDRISDPYTEELGRHAFDAYFILLGRPVSFTKLDQLVLLIIPVTSHVNYALPPLSILGMKFIEDADLVVR